MVNSLLGRMTQPIDVGWPQSQLFHVALVHCSPDWRAVSYTGASPNQQPMFCALDTLFRPIARSGTGNLFGIFWRKSRSEGEDTIVKHFRA